MGILAGLGGVAGLILTALALITPLMIYLIQRNTWQTKDEIKQLHKTVKKLIDIAEYQQQQIEQAEQRAIEEKQQAAERLINMNCPLCGELIKYKQMHSGKKKTCPGCNSPVVLK